MSFLKIGDIILNVNNIDAIDLDHKLRGDESVVRVQMENRKDEHKVLEIDGEKKIVHEKWGVFQFNGEWAEQLRWFIKTFGMNMGVNDVSEAFKHKDEVEKLKAQQAQQMAGLGTTNSKPLNNPGLHIVKSTLPHEEEAEPLA